MRLGTVWTVLFTEPGRYNWLLQYYLRAEGVTLSWVGTGRCVSSMDFTEEDYGALRTKVLNAARTMKADGWWLNAQEHPGREQRMRTGLVREMLGSLIRVPKPLHSVLCGDHAAQEGRPSRLTQQPGQPVLSPRQLERLPLLLRGGVF